MVLGNKLGRKYLVRGFPCVVRFWIPLPFDEILKLLHLPEMAVTPDLFYFEFCFAFDHVRRGPHVVGSMFHCFVIRGQQGGMEDVMNGPGWG